MQKPADFSWGMDIPVGEEISAVTSSEVHSNLNHKSSSWEKGIQMLSLLTHPFLHVVLSLTASFSLATFSP